MTTHVIVNRDWSDYLLAVLGLGSFVAAIVAVVIALLAQRSVGQERRRVFELGILTSILEYHSRGMGAYQGESVVSRLLDALPKEDLPTLRNWLAVTPRVTTEPVDATITEEYREAISRRL